jgi:hypothetical protein
MQCASCGVRIESLNTNYEIPAHLNALNFILLISYKKMVYNTQSAGNRTDVRCFKTARDCTVTLNTIYHVNITDHLAPYVRDTNEHTVLFAQPNCTQEQAF